MVRVPQIADIKTAIDIYYSHITLGNKEIRRLFGKVGDLKVRGLKQAAMDEMLKQGLPVWDAYRVNTQTAYKTWGLDINDLEKRYAKLEKWGLVAKEKET